MKLTDIKTKMARTANNVGFAVKKNSPAILVAVGIAGVVGSTVLACRATLKIDEVLEEKNEQLEKINAYAEANPDSEKYTEEDHTNDIKTVNIQAAAKIAKLYAPSVILGAASITAIVCSHNILNKRNAALAAAYATVDKTFKDYRERVVERFGKELDHELRYNIKSKEIESVTKDEKTGKEKTVKETQTVASLNDISDFARFFDESCPAWTKDAEANKLFLKSQQAYFNNRLQSKGRVFLNEVYEALGFEPTAAGQVVGWVYGGDNERGDNYIDFGIYRENREASRRFVNGIERVILLDFNVDGNIWDSMKSK